MIVFFAKNPRFTLSLLVILIVLGINSYFDISKEERPSIKIPYVFVSAPYEGVSPEDAEKMILKPIEKQVKSVDSLKKMTSYSVTGKGSVVLEFFPGSDSEKILRDVKDRVDMARTSMPSDIDDPFVYEIDFSRFPVLNVILKTKSLSNKEVISRARELSDMIEALPTVLSVNIAGDKEDLVEVVVDQKDIEGYKVSVNDLVSVNSNNKLVASGNLRSKNGDFAVRVPGILDNIKDIENVPLKVGSNSIIKVKDIAKVKKTYKDSEYIARVNGETAIVLEVSKRAGENVIDTIDDVRKAIADATDITEGIDVIYSRDSSQEIMNSLNSLNNSIFIAIIIVLTIVVIFTNIRNGFFIATTIPISFFAGIFGLYMFGYTLNVVVLFGLILSVGMIVDAGVVVVEYAITLIKQGVSYKDAYIQSARRMFAPIAISTCTTLIVFIPLLFWPGTVGKFMRYLPITLLFVLSSSLISAIIFLPTVASVFGTDKISRISLGSENKSGFLNVYHKFLIFVIKRPFKTVITVIILVATIITVYKTFNHGVKFFPDIEPEYSQIKIRTKGNLSIEQKDDITKQVENIVLNYNESVKLVYARVGKGGERSAKDTIAVLDLAFVDWKIRDDADTILQEIREATSQIEGIIVEVGKEKKGPSSDKPIGIEFRSADGKKLQNAVDTFVAYLSNSSDYVDIETSEANPRVEYVVDVNRSLAQYYGVDMTTLGTFIKMITNGAMMTTFRPSYSDDVVDVVLKINQDKRNLSTLNGIKILTNKGLVPISNFATIKLKPETSEIYRLDGKRAISVMSDVAVGVLPKNKFEEITAFIKSDPAFEDIGFKVVGEGEDQAQTSAFLTKAFGLSILVTMLILLAQFRSFFKMAIVMSAVVFSVAGVFASLLLYNKEFIIVMCGIAMVSLIGIVVNNNILLIDMYNEFLQKGYHVRSAVVRATLSRIKPILITSVTTMIGVLPMSFGVNINIIHGYFTMGSPSSQWWDHLSASIIGGLFIATIMSLVFTPAMLVIEWKISLFFKSIKKRWAKYTTAV